MPHVEGSGWIDRLCREIPGLNDRVLTLDDLYQYCAARDFFVLESSMRKLHGCSFLARDGQPSMVINSLLREPERIVAGWHEFTHLLMHSTTSSVFCSTGNLWRHTKTERQAQTIGVIALLPLKILSDDLSNYPAKIVKYRREVWQEYRM